MLAVMQSKQMQHMTGWLTVHLHASCLLCSADAELNPRLPYHIDRIGELLEQASSDSRLQQRRQERYKRMLEREQVSVAAGCSGQLVRGSK